MIVAFSNNKGGVGKTTSAINVARVLADDGMTLLVDFDPQAHATIATLEKPNGASYLDVLRDGVDVRDVIRHGVHFDVLPSHIRMDEIMRDVSEVEHDTVIHLRSTLRTLTEYQNIIIDTPPSYSVITRMGMCAADFVFVPVDPSSFALYGAMHLRGFVDEIAETYGIPISCCGVFITLYDGRRRADRAARKAIEAALPPYKLMRTIVRSNTAIRESIQRRTNVIDYAPTSNGARDYIALGKEIRRRVEEWTESRQR